MKVILTGGTGFVGAEVLRQLADDPAVTEVTCLIRRPVEIESPKVESVVLDDFTQYNDELVAKLSDHSACIWTLGGKESDLKDPAVHVRITHDFTLALATVVADAAGPFVFCYLSGAGADPGETSTFPWERLTRHLKGRTEKDLRALAGAHPRFTVCCFRPAGILPRDTGSAARFLLSPISIRVDELAEALIDVAVRPSATTPAVLSNSGIKHLARAAAKTR
jgi:nucleoside-diphosphate-sugar epimerase